MNRRPAVVLMLLLGVGLSAQEAYPRWFLEAQPPGWASVFSSSEDQALKEAAKVLSAYEQSIVVGDVQQFMDEAVDDRTWKKTDYQVVFDEARAEHLLKYLKVWAQIPVHLLTGDQLYLIGPQKSERKIDSRLVDTGPEPAWVANVGNQGGFVWGVGRFTLQGRTADAWVKAEEQALYQLLTTHQLQLGQWKGTLREGNREELSTLNWVKLKYLVSQVRLEGRWFDREHNDVVVAVSVPASGIKVFGPSQTK